MHYKSSYIQLLLRIIEVSRTFWSRGHTFRSELASPRHDTISSSPRKWGRVALSSATNLFEAVFIPLKAQVLKAIVQPWQCNFLKPLFNRDNAIFKAIVQPRQRDKSLFNRDNAKVILVRRIISTTEPQVTVLQTYIIFVYWNCIPQLISVPENL